MYIYIVEISKSNNSTIFLFDSVFLQYLDLIWIFILDISKNSYSFKFKIQPNIYLYYIYIYIYINLDRQTNPPALRFSMQCISISFRRIMFATAWNCVFNCASDRNDDASS